MNTKPILAFDCSTSAASIALMVGAEVREVRLPHNRHAALLMSEIDVLMRPAGLSYTQLGSMVTTIGPGSFTGLRIGLAALHGMALATGVEVKTLTSLEALAWAVAEKPDAPESFFVGLRAGKGEAYLQAFTIENNRPVAHGEIFLCPEGEAVNHAPYFGNLQPPEHPNYIEAPSAALLCRIAHALPSCALADAVPLYIRAPDAAIPATLPWLA